VDETCRGGAVHQIVVDDDRHGEVIPILGATLVTGGPSGDAAEREGDGHRSRGERDDEPAGAGELRQRGDEGGPRPTLDASWRARHRPQDQKPDEARQAREPARGAFEPPVLDTGATTLGVAPPGVLDLGVDGLGVLVLGPPNRDLMGEVPLWGRDFQGQVHVDVGEPVHRSARPDAVQRGMFGKRPSDAGHHVGDQGEPPTRSLESLDPPQRGRDVELDKPDRPVPRGDRIQPVDGHQLAQRNPVHVVSADEVLTHTTTLSERGRS